MPQNLPHFCSGCFLCLEKGEDQCPHAQYVQPIAQSIREVDGLILTTPVYSLAESGGVKAFLDHFSYIFMNHRPMAEMFSKIAMVISTTVGYGIKHAIKTIKRALRFWGIRRVIQCGLSLFVIKWDEMSQKKQLKFSRVLHSKAKQFSKILSKRERLQPYIFTRFYFYISRNLITSFSDGQPDKEYWKQKGWLNSKKRPF